MLDTRGKLLLLVKSSENIEFILLPYPKIQKILQLKNKLYYTKVLGLFVRKTEYAMFKGLTPHTNFLGH